MCAALPERFLPERAVLAWTRLLAAAECARVAARLPLADAAVSAAVPCAVRACARVVFVCARFARSGALEVFSLVLADLAAAPYVRVALYRALAVRRACRALSQAMPPVMMPVALSDALRAAALAVVDLVCAAVRRASQAIVDALAHRHRADAQSVFDFERAVYSLAWCLRHLPHFAFRERMPVRGADCALYILPEYALPSHLKAYAYYTSIACICP